MSSNSSLNILPDELIIEIIKCLDSSSFFNFSLVCRKLSYVTQDKLVQSDIKNRLTEKLEFDNDEWVTVLPNLTLYGNFCRKIDQYYVSGNIFYDEISDIQFVINTDEDVSDTIFNQYSPQIFTNISYPDKSNSIIYYRSPNKINTTMSYHFGKYSHIYVSNQCNLLSKKCQPCFVLSNRYKGTWRKFINNKQLSLYNFDNGLPNGPWLAYFHNGNIRMMGELKNNLKYGKLFNYDISGNLISIENYNGDKTICIHYYSNGTTKCILTLDNGLLDGLLIKYHPNGNKSEEYIYKQSYKNGKYTKWNSDGIVIDNGFYHNDKRHGNRTINGVNIKYFLDKIVDP